MKTGTSKLNLRTMSRLRSKDDTSHIFYIGLADLMMLLCVFFLLLLSMSKIDTGSFERIKSGFTGSTSGTLVELAQKLQVDTKNMSGVTVTLAEDGVRLDLETGGLFDSASAALKTGSLDKFDAIFKKILTTAYDLDIEGHSDDRPLSQKFGDEIETNWSLSGRRASTVAQHFIRMGFQERRLRIVGFASNKPKVSIINKNPIAVEIARSQNRRVSILIK